VNQPKLAEEDGFYLIALWDFIDLVANGLDEGRAIIEVA